MLRPPPWTFPLQLLDDGSYAEELKDLVRLTGEHRQISPELTHSQRWDDLKRDIRDHATEYLRRVNLRTRALETSLRRSASQARLAFTQQPTAPDSLHRWQQCHGDLQQHIQERAKAAAVRAGVLWQV